MTKLVLIHSLLHFRELVWLILGQNLNLSLGNLGQISPVLPFFPRLQWNDRDFHFEILTILLLFFSLKEHIVLLQK